MPTLADKIDRMRNGEAVILTDEQLDALCGEGWMIRSAVHAGRVGVLDRWVGWMSGSLSTLPPESHIDPETLWMTALPGRCCFSKTGTPVPPDYWVPDDYARLAD